MAKISYKKLAKEFHDLVMKVHNMDYISDEEMDRLKKLAEQALDNNLELG